MVRRLRKFINAALRRRRFEDQMADEMRFHIDAYAADLERQGLSRAQAERRARMDFGAAESVKEDCRQSRGLRLLDELHQDLRYAARQMAKSPGFTAAAVMSLALGIGANTAIFSLMDAVLLRAVPVSDPDRLFYLGHGRGTRTSRNANFPLYERYRQANVLGGVTAYEGQTFPVRLADTIEHVDGQYAAGNYHAVIGVPFAAGHGFVAEDDRQRVEIKAVISDDYWQRRFGRSPSAIGHTLSVAGRAATIVGVTAPGFNGLDAGYRADITLPMWVRTFDDPGYLDDRGGWVSLSIVGRLRRDQTDAQALAALDAVFKPFWLEPENAWIRRTPDDDHEEARLISARRGSADLRRKYSAPLQTLMWMVAIVLLVACGNVANLCLVRAAARSREVAVRLGIGAGRARLARQFLTESLVLAAMGGALGLLVSLVSTRTIMAVLNSGRWPVVLDAGVNVRVLAFTTLASVLTGIGFGLTPALRATRIDILSSLKTIAPFRRGRPRSPVGKTMIVGQIALSVIVVAAAALLGRSLYKLRALDTGFARDHVLLFDVDARDDAFTGERRTAFYPALLDRLRELPGVSSAALADRSPIDSSTQERRIEVPGFQKADGGVSSVAISPAYFEAFGIPLVRGRHFTDGDRAGAAPVAIANESMARFYFGDADPLGRTIVLGGRRDVMTIVGIVGDTRHEGLRGEPPRTVYTPVGQPGESFDGRSGQFYKLTAILRTAGDPEPFGALAARVVRDVDASASVDHVRTISQQVDAALVNERLLATLSTAFGLLALLLATVGLYGVTAYGVARRRREMAIRLALGASRRTVVVRVLSDTLAVSVAGVAIGLSVTFLATRTIASYLFDLSPTDPATLAAVAAVLIATAVLAALLPARRAATTPPTIALRAE
jgi:macrolide transport system ATP-binding/permease protein